MKRRIRSDLDVGISRPPPPSVASFQDREFPSQHHFIHAVSRTLARGQEAFGAYSRRPALPIELVVVICRFACFTTTQPVWRWRKSFPEERPAAIKLSSMLVGRKLVFVSPPISEQWLRRMGGFQLTTISRLEVGHVPPRQVAPRMSCLCVADGSAESMQAFRTAGLRSASWRMTTKVLPGRTNGFPLWSCIENHTDLKSGSVPTHPNIRDQLA